MSTIHPRGRAPVQEAGAHQSPPSTIPDCADPRAITTYALQSLTTIITAYQDFLNKARGRDDVSFALVVNLLAVETHRRADVQAALANQ